MLELQGFRFFACELQVVFRIAGQPRTLLWGGRPRELEIRTSIYPTRRTGAPLMYNHGCDLVTPKALLDTLITGRC